MDFHKYSPMLAISGTPFDDTNYLFEIKWDGIRAIALITREATTLYSRNGNNISHRYPELDLTGMVSKYPAVLDGEIVVLKDGLPSFHTLQTRDHLQDPKKIRSAAQEMPAIFMVFDILHLGGEDLFQHALIERKEVLTSAVQQGAHLLISQYITGAGKAFSALTKEKGLEGVMAKRLDSTYQIGKRSNFWIKFRNTKTMSCVICGYVSGSGSRNSLGSLILGAYDHNVLRYVGNAGSGLDGREIEFLLKNFNFIPNNANPFKASLPLKNPTFVEPELVCEVSYLERVAVLRHPTFLGLRRDLKPQDCVWKQG
jgi:DNA ligase D-like protein (predicted ligase)